VYLLSKKGGHLLKECCFPYLLHWRFEEQVAKENGKRRRRGKGGETNPRKRKKAIGERTAPHPGFWKRAGRGVPEGKKLLHALPEGEGEPSYKRKNKNGVLRRISSFPDFKKKGSGDDERTTAEGGKKGRPYLI